MRAGAKYSGASNALLNFRKEAPNRVTSTLVWDCHLSATHMMMLMLIVGLLLSHGEALARTPEGLRIPFTQEFRELMAYMQGTEAGARIYRKVSSAQYSYNQRLDNKECPQRLFHIIKKKMKCPTVAGRMEPQLFSIHLEYSMMANEQLWEGIGMYHNCSRLSEEDYSMCEKGLLFLAKYDTRNYFMGDLNQEIDKCYLEERGNQTSYFTKR